MGTYVDAQQDTQEHYAKLVSFNASIMIMIMIIISSCILFLVLLLKRQDPAGHNIEWIFNLIPTIM